MDDYSTLFIELLRRDRRYGSEAYLFVREVLSFAQEKGLAKKASNEPLPQNVLEQLPDRKIESEKELGDHITGQDLCHAAREYAIRQYGFLAKTVLNSIGIRKTDDIGDIVYNLISIGQMRKSPNDQKEDFNDVYDFNIAFGKSYQILLH